MNLNFDQDNAYYVWNRVINEPDGTVIPAEDSTTPPTRGYVSDQTTQSAVDWIHQQDADGQTWMATVAYASDHTPYQQPPRELPLPIQNSPAGIQTMPEGAGDEPKFTDARPWHRVRLSGYWIDKNTVTNAQFRPLRGSDALRHRR